MKEFLVSIALLLLIQQSQPEECDGQSFYTSCVDWDSCDYLQVCLGPFTDYRQCRSIDPEKPFCNKGTCSDTPDFSICSPQGIVCTGKGIFPDPEICTLIHHCEDAYSISNVTQCPEGQVFNPETLSCKQQTSSQDCMKVKCDSIQLYSRYGTSKQFFGFCQYHGIIMPQIISIFRCPDGTEFNGSTCGFSCPTAGRFPNPADASTFFDCYEAEGAAKLSKCATGKVFDAARKACVTAALAG